MKHFFLAATLVISFSFASIPAVASDIRLTSDPSVPAAAGKAHLDKDKNGNLKLKIEVYHLAQPSALTPARQTYVVWTQPRGKSPENQGQLRVNNKLEGKFETTVPREVFDVFVTGEDTPTIETPSEPRLLTGTVQP